MVCCAITSRRRIIEKDLPASAYWLVSILLVPYRRTLDIFSIFVHCIDEYGKEASLHYCRRVEVVMMLDKGYTFSFSFFEAN